MYNYLVFWAREATSQVREQGRWLSFPLMICEGFHGWARNGWERREHVVGCEYDCVCVFLSPALCLPLLGGHVRELREPANCVSFINTPLGSIRNRKWWGRKYSTWLEKCCIFLHYLHFHFFLASWDNNNWGKGGNRRGQSSRGGSKSVWLAVAVKACLSIMQ